MDGIKYDKMEIREITTIAPQFFIISYCIHSTLHAIYLTTKIIVTFSTEYLKTLYTLSLFCL